MTNVSDYREHWKSIYQAAYAQGCKHWRPEKATPPAFVEFMQSSWAPPPGSRILEAGCSDGLNVIYLAALGHTVTGVDISDEAIERAREVTGTELAGVQFLCLDLVHDNLPPTDRYDLWIDIKTLHCLWEDDERRRYLARAADTLVPGGLLFLNCALALADVKTYFPEVFAALDAEPQADAEFLDRDVARDDRTGIRCETLEWYCQELKDAGFEICDAKREASTESGWGVVIVARKGGD